jgi:hypothetical protein
MALSDERKKEIEEEEREREAVRERVKKEQMEKNRPRLILAAILFILAMACGLYSGTNPFAIPVTFTH